MMSQRYVSGVYIKKKGSPRQDGSGSQKSKNLPSHVMRREGRDPRKTAILFVYMSVIGLGDIDLVAAGGLGE